jgi:hypothetical protein
MDRISALRNIEDSLARYEEGELSLPELERDVRGTIRTYATDFEDARAYRARGDPAADGLVVVADSPTAAREQLAGLVPEDTSFEVDPLDQ